MRQPEQNIARDIARLVEEDTARRIEEAATRRVEQTAARRSGPDVVAIGGGRGLSVTLSATRQYARYTTAVVSTADDSGSTGRLRSAMPIPALGDLRRCLSALAGAGEGPLGMAFEYRFAGTDIEGHTLGNLLLAGLAATTGDVLAATSEVARLLGMNPDEGQVLPATAEPVDLWARTGSGEIHGQYAISQTEGIQEVALEPAAVKAPSAIRDAVRSADQIILGPGSLFTSVLAAAMVEELHEALLETSAPSVYVCNLIEERSETIGFDVADHVDALRHHGIHPDVVLIGSGDRIPLGDVRGIDVIRADLAGPDGCAHDPSKLADALAALAA